MLSSNSIQEISKIFCGDIPGFYVYKQGCKLVNFFNNNFGMNDVYTSGFKTRWTYVNDKIRFLIDRGLLNKLFNIILSKNYLMKEQLLSEVEAALKIENIYKEFNRIIQKDSCKIIRNNGQFFVIKVDEDLEKIGSGGFAEVYREKSTGLVIKKLKDDFLTDSHISSRFKREFEITKSLQDIRGIIKVYDFDEGNASYTMEFVETTLYDYIKSQDLTDVMKVNIIRQILEIMAKVHERNIIHRDISANNIFIASGIVKIADFGLGKDLDILHSHQTMCTYAVGQYHYCAPEQYKMLKDGDKRSDVYSLGCIINFIMTGDPDNSHHKYRSVVEKARYSDVKSRYDDAQHLLYNFNKYVIFKRDDENQRLIDEKISQRKFDNEVANYINDLTEKEISKFILQEKNCFKETLLTFMKISDNNAMHVVNSIYESYREVCGRRFENYDPFATFAYNILCDIFSFVIKEKAAHILSYVAHDVNRFSAQRLIEYLISDGVDPLIEEILECKH